jgi:hypothetical protein
MITNSHHASGLPGTAAAQRKPACGASPPAAARQAGRVGDQGLGTGNSVAKPAGNAPPVWPATLDRTAGHTMRVIHNYNRRSCPQVREPCSPASRHKFWVNLTSNGFSQPVTAVLFGRFGQPAAAPGRRRPPPRRRPARPAGQRPYRAVRGEPEAQRPGLPSPGPGEGTVFPAIPGRDLSCHLRLAAQ